MNITGKKLCVLGDSITQGAGLERGEDLFWKVLEQEQGLRQAVGYGIGGTRIARQKTEREDLSADSCFSCRYQMCIRDRDEPSLWFQDPKISLILLIFVQLWLSLGVGFLAFIAGLQNVDRQLYEAAAIDGIRSRWHELWYITLPAMKPMLIFGGLNQIVAAFSVGDISMTLCGFPSIQYAAHTVSLHAYDYGILRYEIGYSAAVSLLLFAIILFTYKLFVFAVSRIGR